MTENNVYLLWLWIAVLVGVFFYEGRRAQTVGLSLSSVTTLFVYYWFGGLVHELHWYALGEYLLNAPGFQLATIGFVAFSVGNFIIGPRVADALNRRKAVPEVDSPRILPFIYIALGILIQAIPNVLGPVPLSGALSGTGWALLLLGFNLALLIAWRRNKSLEFLVLLFLVLAGFPFYSVVFQGFLGAGAFAGLTICTFSATYVRPKWLTIIFGLLVVFGGLSVYVTYMRDRTEIREVVWGGSRIEERVARLFETLATVEWFDLYNEQHLWHIDSRLNGNLFLGEAVHFLGQGLEPFAEGETMTGAAIALIPRALWPDKPLLSGGTQWATRFTGVIYEGTTSIGFPQIAEWYVNFGIPGIVCGLLALGTIVRFFDSMAGCQLNRGDWASAAIWYLPGYACSLTETSVVEMVAGAGMGVVAGVIISAVVRQRRNDQLQHGRSLGWPIAIPDAPRINGSS